MNRDCKFTPLSKVTPVPSSNRAPVGMANNNDKITPVAPVPSYIFNQALVTLVLQEASEGKMQRCKSLGFTPDLVLRLQSLAPTKLHKVVSSPYLWIKPSIDPRALELILDKIDRDEELERLINRAIKLGATTPMLNIFFGLSHTEVAERRRTLQVQSRTGRLPALSNEQRHAVWERWVALVQQLEKSHGCEPAASIQNIMSGAELDEMNQLDLMLVIAEEQNILVGQIWLEIAECQSGEDA